MTTIFVGTSHFVSKSAAMRYYKDYNPGNTREDMRRIVDRKLSEGDIHIGPPALAANEVLSTIDGNTRYAIAVSTEQ